MVVGIIVLIDIPKGENQKPLTLVIGIFLWYRRICIISYKLIVNDKILKLIWSKI